MATIDVTISTRATHLQVRRALYRIPRIAAGASGAKAAADALLVRIGLTALARIRDAFLVKARGGADESGLRWPPLAPSTIAYSRRHPGVPPKHTRARYRPSWMLTASQRKEWWSVYSRYLAAFDGNKGHAAAAAWKVLKDEGAQTLIGTYGHTNVEILRDTGLLFNSLSPGLVPGLAPVTRPPRRQAQVFNIGRGEIIVGTNRKWAGTHHRGVPGHIPQRRLWPEPSRWPVRWWNDILTQTQQGLVDIAISLLGAT